MAKPTLEEALKFVKLLELAEKVPLDEETGDLGELEWLSMPIEDFD